MINSTGRFHIQVFQLICHFDGSTTFGKVILVKVQISFNAINSIIIIPKIESDFHGTLLICQLTVVAINASCFCCMRINKSMQRLHLVISFQLTADIGKVQRNIVDIDIAGAIRNLSTAQINAACDIKVAVN